MPNLKRTQIYLPEDMFRELKRKAEEEKSTVSDIVRGAVREFLGKEREKNWREDPLWRMVGGGSSGDGTLSARHDEYLYGKKP